MGKLYLVRHGEVAWNSENAYVGATDIPLNERGQRQAEALAEWFSHVGISAVYASTLSRAMATASAIAAPHGLQVIPEGRLREMNYGDWEGMPEQLMAENYPDEYTAWRSDPLRAGAPNGDTFGDVRDRALPALRRIAEAHPDDEVVVVAHKCVNRIILCELLGIDIVRYRSIDQVNACYNILRTRADGFVVDAVNEACHLQGI